VLRLGRFVARLIVLLTAPVVALALLYRWVNPPFTPLMVLRTFQVRAASRSSAIANDWVPLERISPALIRAVVVAEDGNFFHHHGVDWDALQRALDYNAHHGGKPLRGAGTITMQCARNVFLWPGRSYLRKALEIGLAHVLELLWGKRRILEVYLNVIEWGDGVFGIEAAAQRSFGVHAAQLDAHSAALLAAVLPDPRRWNPTRPGPYVQARAALIQARSTRLSPAPPLRR